MARSRKTKRKTLDMDDVIGAVSETIEMLRHYIRKPHDEGLEVDRNELSKLSHALFQGAGVYNTLRQRAAIDEVAELKEQVAELREERRPTQIRA